MKNTSAFVEQYKDTMDLNLLRGFDFFLCSRELPSSFISFSEVMKMDYKSMSVQEITNVWETMVRFNIIIPTGKLTDAKHNYKKNEQGYMLYSYNKENPVAAFMLKLFDKKLKEICDEVGKKVKNGKTKS